MAPILTGWVLYNHGPIVAKKVSLGGSQNSRQA